MSETLCEGSGCFSQLESSPKQQPGIVCISLWLSTSYQAAHKPLAETLQTGLKSLGAPCVWICPPSGPSLLLDGL